MIWRYDEGLGIKESHLALVADANNVLGDALAADGDKTAEREPTKALNARDALGPELLLNGDFLTDVSWTKGDGWTIPEGAGADCDGTQAAASDLTQAITLQIGTTYRVAFQVTALTAGAVSPVVGGTKGQVRLGVSTFVENLVAGAANFFDIEADADFVGTVDNISLKEVL